MYVEGLLITPHEFENSSRGFTILIHRIDPFVPCLNFGSSICFQLSPLLKVLGRSVSPLDLA